MLLGFPYGQDFVYDEMVLTGPGEKGEANAKKVMAANNEKSGPNAPKPGEGPSKEERENGLYDLLFVAIAPDGRQVRAAVKGDRDPGYGSTSKMISECAICLLRDAPDVPAGIWTPGAAMQHKLIKRLVDNAGLTFRWRSKPLASSGVARSVSVPTTSQLCAMTKSLRRRLRSLPITGPCAPEPCRLSVFGGNEHAPHGAQHQPEMAPVVGIDDEALADGAEEGREDRDIGALPRHADEEIAEPHEARW